MKTDGQRERRSNRVQMGLAIGYGFGAVLILWVARPGFIDMFHPSYWYDTVLPVVGIASYLIGLGLMVRIYRAQPEPGERTWRYRDTDGTTRGPALKTADGRRGRRIARGLIVLAIVWGIGALFLWVAQPGYIGPMFAEPQAFEIWLPILVVASYFIGLAWMVRIYRANPEPGERTWRYRDH